VQGSSQIITINKPIFTGRMPFLLPNQQCQSTEGKISPLLLLLNTITAVYFAFSALTLSGVRQEEHTAVKTSQ